MKHIVQIKEPCHENWNNMSVSEKGRFCDSCSKQVVDFTKKSNEEIAAHLNNASDKVCGRVTASQLGCSTEIPPVQSPGFFSKFRSIAASVLAIIAVTLVPDKKAAAQSKGIRVGMMVFDTTVKGKMAISEEITSVKGQITETYSENPLPLTQVIIESGNKTIGSTTTDSNGEYRIDIEPGNLVNNRITVTVSCPGYETKILNDLPMEKKEITLSLDMNNVIRMGDIIATEQVVVEEPESVQIKTVQTKHSEQTQEIKIEHFFLGQMVAIDLPIDEDPSHPSGTSVSSSIGRQRLADGTAGSGSEQEIEPVDESSEASAKEEEVTEVIEEIPMGDIDIIQVPEYPENKLNNETVDQEILKIIETIPDNVTTKTFETVYINYEGEEIENPNFIVDNAEIIIVEEEEILESNEHELIPMDENSDFPTDEEENDLVEIEEGLKPKPTNFNPEIIESAELVSKLYPNPANNHFTLLLNNENIYQVEIYDSAGRMVKNQQIRGIESNVDINNLRPGSYLVKVISGTQVETKNVVVY